MPLNDPSAGGIGSVRPWKSELTLWVRGDESRPEPTRKVRVTADAITAAGFSFRHGDFLQPGTIVLAYLAAFPDSPLVETQVCDCSQDSGDGMYRVAVAVKGRCNRLPLLAREFNAGAPQA
jgi:hypothetical protein